jgi:hypothetical protein
VTANELKDIQHQIKFDAPSMAACLGVPYHTFRNYIYGENEIPAKVERAALELVQINACYLAGVYDRVDARIAADGGVPNEARANQ